MKKFKPEQSIKNQNWLLFSKPNFPYFCFHFLPYYFLVIYFFSRSDIRLIVVKHFILFEKKETFIDRLIFKLKKKLLQMKKKLVFTLLHWVNFENLLHFTLLINNNKKKLQMTQNRFIYFIPFFKFFLVQSLFPF